MLKLDGSGINDFVKACLYWTPATATTTALIECHRFEVILGREKSTDEIFPPCIWIYIMLRLLSMMNGCRIRLG